MSVSAPSSGEPVTAMLSNTTPLPPVFWSVRYRNRTCTEPVGSGTVVTIGTYAPPLEPAKPVPLVLNCPWSSDAGSERLVLIGVQLAPLSVETSRNA